jgi:hypothetical protein
MEGIAKSLNIVFNNIKVPANWHEIDKIEKYLSTFPVKQMGDLYEECTPGLYTRQLTIPEGTLMTSAIHKSCHPFVITEGKVTVYNTVTDETELFVAGHRGITYPGTRRCLYFHEKTVWITFHSTNLIDYDCMNLDKQSQQVIFDEIMKDILQPYDNPLTIDFNEGTFI